MKYGRSIFGKLPKKSGAYIIDCDGRIVYAGKTNNLQRRAKEHSRSGRFGGCRFKPIQTRNEVEAGKIEKRLINRNCPPDNNLGKKNCPPDIWDILGFKL